MKILILTNTKNYELIEDKWIGESFEKDGNQVTYVNTIKKADFTF